MFKGFIFWVLVILSKKLLLGIFIGVKSWMLFNSKGWGWFGVKLVVRGEFVKVGVVVVVIISIVVRGRWECRVW